MQPSITGTESAERVADVLLSFAHNGGLIGVSALARSLGLSKAVVHRILQSLVSRELVQYSADTRDYRLGPAAAVLGAQALRELDVRSVARLPLMQLRDATGETTTLSLLSGGKRTYISQYESPHEVKMTVELGRMYPLHAGASSRAILAHLPKAIIERVVTEGLTAVTPYTITDGVNLHESLISVRKLGYSRSSGERQADASSIAAPLFGPHHEVIGAISICGPSGRFSKEVFQRYASLVVATATEISRLMVEH